MSLHRGTLALILIDYFLALEAAIGGVLLKTVLKNSKYLQENTCVGVSFLIKLQP